MVAHALIELRAADQVGKQHKHSLVGFVGDIWFRAASEGDSSGVCDIFRSWEGNKFSILPDILVPLVGWAPWMAA